MRVMWMRPNRAKNVFIGLSDPADRIKRLRVCRNGDHPPNPSGAGAFDHGITLGGEISEVEVAVTVNQHGGPLYDDLPPLRCNAEKSVSGPAKTILPQDLGRSRHGRMFARSLERLRGRAAFPSKLA